ncbi:MAG TPA: SRPBCC family protein [Pyrinomonadaceae bacterium]
MATATKRELQRAEGDRQKESARSSSQTPRQTGRRRQPARSHAGTNAGKPGVTQTINAEQLAQGLGWFSLGLGLAELLTPGAIAKISGVRGNTGFIRLMGLREICHGIAIFAQGKRPAAAVWSRVAGDALDLAALGSAFASPDSNKGRLAFATANVLTVAALDVICARQLSTGDSANEGGANQVKQSMIINRSPEEVYGFWRRLENLPRFMRHLESVQETGTGRSHWVAKAPAGSSVEWDAEITEDRPNELIAWRSLEGADVDNSGSVRFEPATGGRGTVVHVEMEYNPPGGVLGALVAKLFGEEPGQQAQESLRTLKQVMETGEIIVSDGTVWDNGLMTQRPAQPVSAEELGSANGAA